MSDLLTVRLLTQEEEKLVVETVEIRGQTPSGMFSIHPGHTPLMTTLSICPLELYETAETIHRLALTGGFLQVRDNDVLILARTAELPGEIDVERAESSKDRAEQRLDPADKKEELDYARAMAAMSRALVRLDVAGALS